MRGFFRGLTAKTLFFGVIATILLWNEFFLQPSPRPWGVLSAFFLYGLIPAFWGDAKLPSIPDFLRALADAMSKSTKPSKSITKPQDPPEAAQDDAPQEQLSTPSSESNGTGTTGDT